MTWAELEKRLKKVGWQLYDHGKEHDRYRRPGNPGYIQIGRHKTQEVPSGTLNKILKQAGLK